MRLITTAMPIAHKYSDGTVKRTLERECKVLKAKDSGIGM